MIKVPETVSGLQLMILILICLQEHWNWFHECWGERMLEVECKFWGVFECALVWYGVLYSTGGQQMYFYISVSQLSLCLKSAEQFLCFPF